MRRFLLDKRESRINFTNLLYLSDFFIKIHKIFLKKQMGSQILYVNAPSTKLLSRVDDSVLVGAKATTAGVTLVKLIATFEFYNAVSLQNTIKYVSAVCLYNTFSNKNTISYRPDELIHICRQAYLIFFNAGAANSKFAVVGSDKIWLDWQAVNYAVLNSFGRRNFFSNMFFEVDVQGRAFDVLTRQYAAALDYIFLLDQNINLSKELGIYDTHPFLIGLNNDVFRWDDYDVCIPVDGSDLHAQLYFIEFVASATADGIFHYRNDIFKKLINIQNCLLETLL